MRYTITQPRAWTPQDTSLLLQLKQQGLSTAQIAAQLNRSQVSISVKLKRLSKANNTYNTPHLQEKYQINSNFLDHLNPTSILDAYCGQKSFYSKSPATVYTNDKNPAIPALYHMDALHLLCHLYTKKQTFDLIDLDPFGSAYDCFDLAIKMANKGLIITLGELGHKRFKRLDYVSSHYGITSLQDFTIDNLITHIQSIGKRNKKALTVYAKKEWRNIGRVWFTISPIKITSQWDKSNNTNHENS